MSRYIKAVAIYATCAMFGLFPSCSKKDSSAEIKSPTVTAQRQGTLASIELKPLDSPQNPYRQHYDSWDVWAHSHLKDFNEITPKVLPAGSHNMLVAFDNAGWLLPSVERERLRQERLKGNATVDTSGWSYTDAVGPMDEAMFNAHQAALDDVVCKYFPQVPDWLIAAPPIRTKLLPNGNVATFGPLGSGSIERAAKKPLHADHTDNPTHLNSNQWYYLPQFLYDPEGNLLGQSKLCVTPILEKLPGKPLESGTLRNDAVGHTYFLRFGSQEIISVWDYDGTYLGTSLPQEPRAKQPFQTLEGWQLKKLYDAQRRLVDTQEESK